MGLVVEHRTKPIELQTVSPAQYGGVPILQTLPGVCDAGAWSGPSAQVRVRIAAGQAPVPVRNLSS